MQLNVRARRRRCIEPLNRLFNGSQVFGKVADRDRPELSARRDGRTFEATGKSAEYISQTTRVAILNFEYLALEILLCDIVVRRRRRLICTLLRKHCRHRKYCQ